MNEDQIFLFQLQCFLLKLDLNSSLTLEYEIGLLQELRQCALFLNCIALNKNSSASKMFATFNYVIFEACDRASIFVSSCNVKFVTFSEYICLTSRDEKLYMRWTEPYVFKTNIDKLVKPKKKTLKKTN